MKFLIKIIYLCVVFYIPLAFAETTLVTNTTDSIRASAEEMISNLPGILADHYSMQADNLDDLSKNLLKEAKELRNKAKNMADKVSLSKKADLLEKQASQVLEKAKLVKQQSYDAKQLSQSKLTLAEKMKSIKLLAKVNVAVLSNLWDNYSLYSESEELRKKYPTLNLGATPTEYVLIDAVNFVSYFTGLYGIAIKQALNPVETAWEEYDLMPSDPARRRSWVIKMQEIFNGYMVSGFPSGWQDGTSAPPRGLLQFMQATNNSQQLEIWLKSWKIADYSVTGGPATWVNPIANNTCANSNNYVCTPTLGNVISGITSGSNSHIGSANIYTGWGNNNSNAASTNPNNPSNTSNASLQTGAQQSALVTNTQAFASTGWTLVEGDDATHLAFSNNFGSITAPNNGPIVSLNNAEVQQTTMQRVFTIPTGVKQVTVGMMANFVTNEYPQFVGSQYNDKAVIEIKTGSGNVYQATLFNKELNSANFTPVNGLPIPMETTGGQTGFENIAKTISVANGGKLTITVKTLNVGDTAVPSATLINSTSVK